MAETHLRVPASTRIHPLDLCPVGTQEQNIKNYQTLNFLKQQQHNADRNIITTLLHSASLNNPYHVIHFLLFAVPGIILS